MSTFLSLLRNNLFSISVNPSHNTLVTLGDHVPPLHTQHGTNTAGKKDHTSHLLKYRSVRRIPKPSSARVRVFVDPLPVASRRRLLACAARWRHRGGGVRREVQFPQRRAHVHRFVHRRLAANTLLRNVNATNQTIVSFLSPRMCVMPGKCNDRLATL